MAQCRYTQPHHLYQTLYSQHQDNPLVHHSSKNEYKETLYL